MKEFVVSADDFKAKLKIDGNEYKFRSPSTGELLDFNTKSKSTSTDDAAAVALGADLLGKLGNVPKEIVDKLPADIFMNLLKHLVTPFGEEGSKKS